MKEAAEEKENRADNVPSGTVLIIDDQSSDRIRLKVVCSHSRFKLRVHECPSIEEGLDILAKETIHVLLLDRSLKNEGTDEQNGIEFIPQFLELQPCLQILVVTGSKDVNDVVRAIHHGASNYILKDTQDELIAAQIERSIAQAHLTLKDLRRERAKKPEIEFDLVGNSRSIRKLKIQLRAVAESDRPVLLLGDSGTGKTTAAKWIHRFRESHQVQSGSPFHCLNMAAISPSLAERELFGNERGAFTDAREARPGFFELSNEGTLFLDEIGEAPLELQSKLLKVIEEGTFYRLGGQRSYHSKFKLICATNRNLEEMVSDGRFREDLYMRISTLVISIPTLEERKEDIEDIIRSLLPKCSEENRIRNVVYEDLPIDLIEYIRENPPKGNIRGIEHLLSRLLVYAPKTKDQRPDFSNWRSYLLPRGRVPSGISKDEIRLTLDFGSPTFPGLPALMNEVEKQIVLKAKERFPKLIELARTLKTSKSGLHRRLAELEIEKRAGEPEKHLRSMPSKTLRRSTHG